MPRAYFGDESTACRVRLGRVRDRPPKAEIIILCGGHNEFMADGQKRIMNLWRTATKEYWIYGGRPQGPHPANGCYARRRSKSHQWQINHAYAVTPEEEADHVSDKSTTRMLLRPKKKQTTSAINQPRVCCYSRRRREATSCALGTHSLRLRVVIRSGLIWK